MKSVAQAFFCLIVASNSFGTTQLPPDWETRPVVADVAPKDYGELYRLFTASVLKSDEIAKLREAGYTPALLRPQAEFLQDASSTDYLKSVILSPEWIASEAGVLEKSTGTKLALIYIAITRIAPPDADGVALVELSSKDSESIKLKAILVRRGWTIKNEK